MLCNYPYLLDEKVNSIVLDNLPENSIAIIDEAHNIDDVCLEAKTVRINNYLLNLAFENLENLKKSYEEK